MPRKNDEERDLTPQGRLGEATLHAVIGYQVAQASIVTLAIFDACVGQRLALRPVEYTLLVLMKENPGTSPVRMAKALAVAAGSITMWVDRLVDRGLVRRQASEADRRSQHLYVTRAGEALVGDATRRLLECERTRLTRLSTAERAMLAELLHKVALSR